MMANVWLALGLTVVAGMATAFGSCIAFFAKQSHHRFLSVSMGFSAGVMLYVSFVEIFFKGMNELTQIYGLSQGQWLNTLSFFGGMILIAVIDTLIPSHQNPHEPHKSESKQLNQTNAPLTSSEINCPNQQRKLMRMGTFTALAIAIHNFPEGLATFLAALNDPSVGVAIALAIALHNIPEGISVSVPIYYATGRRRKAFFYSILSGLAEPVGALIALGVLSLFSVGQAQLFPPSLMGVLFGGVAGIMVYISLDSLLPTSRAYGKGHDTIMGLVAGMAVMALSLLLMSPTS